MGSENDPQSDSVQVIDRLFMARYAEPVLYLPQVPRIAAGLSGAARDGIWYLIRADSAIPVFSHLRQVLSGIPGHHHASECGICPVETIGSGSLTSMLRRADKLGADITPRPVPNARVTISHVPRYNEVRSDGSWTYPPEAASTSA